MTFKEALQLKPGQILYHKTKVNKDGSPVRWRVIGKIKIWKTRPDEIQIPVKHGSYDYDYLTEKQLHMVCLNENLLEPGDSPAHVLGCYYTVPNRKQKREIKIQP